MPNKPRKRDYKREYETYHKSAAQKKNRVMRNKARRDAIRKHGKRALVGKDVDHIKPLSKGGSNRPANRRIVSSSKNRARNFKSTKSS